MSENQCNSRSAQEPDNGSAKATTDSRPYETPPLYRNQCNSRSAQEPDKGAQRRATNRRSGRSDEGLGNHGTTGTLPRRSSVSNVLCASTSVRAQAPGIAKP